MNLELSGLCKTFPGNPQPVLQDLDFSCKDCRALALLGPSGSGKSTLLRLLAGLIHADSGSIRVNGEHVPPGEQAARVYRRKLGIVFQSYNLFPHLSAIGNILLPLENVHAYGAQKARLRATELFERFGLEAQQHQMAGQLSGGQRQRVALIRAIAHKPKLVLMDEPTSALDPEMAASLLSMVEELKKEGTDFILVTHQIPFARRIAERVLFLCDGRIQESGDAGIFEKSQDARFKSFLDAHLNY